MHLECHYFAWNEKQRVRELEGYLAYIEQTGSYEHLILGDFNAIAPGDVVNTLTMPLKEKVMVLWERNKIYREAISLLLAKGYKDLYRSLNSEEGGNTIPSHQPQVRLDYIFASPAMFKSAIKSQVVSIPTLTTKASDHLPLIAEFEFPDE